MTYRTSWDLSTIPDNLILSRAVAETIMSMPLLIGPDNPKGLVEFAYALAEALVEQRDGPEAK